MHFFKDSHHEQAHVFPLPSGQTTTVRLKAPEGAPTEPGEWEPLTGGGGAVTTETTDWYSAGWSLGGPLGDPDVAAADPDNSYVDSWYPAAMIDCYRNYLYQPEIYYHVGLTTLSLSTLAGGAPAALPNAFGPELAWSGPVTTTWEIRGNHCLYTSVVDDPRTAQLEDVITHIALAPAALCEDSGDGEDGHPQFTWKQWPTKTVLDGLIKVGSIPALELTGLAWTQLPYDGTWYAEAPLEYDLEIDPTWVVDGKVHLAYWMERVSDGSRFFDVEFATPFTYTLEQQYPDAAGTVRTGVSYTAQSMGNWMQDGAGGLYLASNASDGAIVAYLDYITFGAPHNDEKDIEFTFNQVSTNDFGYTCQESAWQCWVAVTPDRVVLSNQNLPLVTIATHSTPFATGDACRIEVRGDDYEVFRNGVSVSTFARQDHPQYPGLKLNNGVTVWATVPNAGNVLSGVTVTTTPRTMGNVAAYMELNYHASLPSQFTSTAPDQMRWLHAIGYPRAFVERFDGEYYNGATNYVVMWLKPEIDTETAAVWYGAFNPMASDDPAAEWSTYTDCRQWQAWQCMVRLDGQLVATYEIGSDQSDVHWPWLWVPGVNSVLDFPDEGDYGSPEEQLALSKQFTPYIRVMLGPHPDNGYLLPEDWDEEPWADLAFHSRAMPAFYPPKVWQWGPEDDRLGFQGVGYSYDPQVLSAAPEDFRAGAMLMLQETDEEWAYLLRDTIFGYTEQDGLFFYGYVQPGAAATAGFDDASILSYGEAVSMDNAGRVFTGVDYEWAHVGYRVTFEHILTANWGYVTNDVSDSINHFSYRIFGSPNYQPNTVTRWAGDVNGAYPALIPAGQMSLLCDSGGNYLWENYRENLDFYLHYKVASDLAGHFVRGDASNTYHLAFSRTQLVKRVGATETVLATYTPIPNDCIVRTVTIGEDIWMYVDDVEWVHVQDDLGTEMIQGGYGGPGMTFAGQGFGLWAVAGGGNVRIRDAEALTSVSAGDSNFNIVGNRSYGLTMLRRAHVAAQAIGETVTAALPWKTSVDLDTRHLYTQGYEILWTVWSPAYPSSFFVLVASGDNVPIPGTLRYTETVNHWMFELDENTGAVIRSMNPFVDTSQSYYYQSSDEVLVSQSGGRLSAVFGSGPGTPQILRTYDLATEQIISSQVADYDVVGGTGYAPVELDDGRLLLGDYDIYDPETNLTISIDYEPYFGKGYNGFEFGCDGRYLWGAKLNYHVDESQYRLTEADVEGTVEVAGTVVDAGSYYGHFFLEVYRYDLLVATAAATLSYLPVGAAQGDLANWQDPLPAGSTLQPFGSGVLVTGSVPFTGLSDGDDIFTLRHEPFARPVGVTQMLFSGTMRSRDVYAGRWYGWARIKVSQYDSLSDPPISVTEGSPQQYQINWHSDADAQLQVYLQPDTNWLVVEFIYRYTERDYYTSQHEVPRASVTNIRAVSAGGVAPIEYMFNLEVPWTQGSQTGVLPRLSPLRANSLDHSEWDPQIGESEALFTLSQFTDPPSSTLTVGPGYIDVSVDDLGYLEVYTTEKLPLSSFPYGPYDYYLATAQVQRIQGTDSGWYTVTPVYYNEYGGILGFGSTTAYLLVSGISTTEFTYLKGSADNYPWGAYGQSVTHIGWLFFAYSADPDAVFRIKHPNLVASIYSNTYNDVHDYDPDNPPPRDVLGWYLRNGGIGYYYPSTAKKGVFAPAPPRSGAKPPLSFDRFLTHQADQDASRIGFGRMGT